MRKLLKELFYVPKYGKVREKVMLMHVVLSVSIIVMCLAAMSLSAYAYFSYNITSASNVIKTANFEANVSITITDSKSNTVNVTKDGKVQIATLDAGSYTVELTKGTSTAKTGFCIIIIGDTDYYTQQIGVDVGRNLTDASVKFTLKVASATKIEIFSHWGTSSCYGYEEASNNPIYIESGDKIDLTTSTIGNDETSLTKDQDAAESTTSTEPSTTPTMEGTIPSTENMETSEPTITTEPSGSATETTTQTTEPAATETTNTDSSTEIQLTAETTEPTDAATTEASE